jgi:3-oxoacyl-[acyl-carrier-protein] synthase-3
LWNIDVKIVILTEEKLSRDMSHAKFDHVKVTGISVVIPSKEIKFEEESSKLWSDAGKIRRMQSMIGFGTRRVVEGNVTASDLSAQAARRLLETLEVSPSSLDAIVFVVQTPDYFCPASACIIHKALKLPTSCLAFDVNQGCAGYVYGLYIAGSLVESGACKRVLLCAGDTPSRLTTPANRITAPIFGDAGSATLVEYGVEQSPSYYSLGAEGSGSDVIIVPGGGTRMPVGRTPEECASLTARLVNSGNETSLLETYMDGLEVLNFTLRVVPQHIHELLAEAGIAVDEIDHFIPHQANKQIVESLSSALGFPPEKALSQTFTKYGNQTIASLPATMCDVLPTVLTGSPKRYLLSGFGVGLSWGSCILELGNLGCASIEQYEKPQDFEERDAIIARWTAKLRGECS